MTNKVKGLINKVVADLDTDEIEDIINTDIDEIIEADDNTGSVLEEVFDTVAYKLQEEEDMDNFTNLLENSYEVFEYIKKSVN